MYSYDDDDYFLESRLDFQNQFGFTLDDAELDKYADTDLEFIEQVERDIERLELNLVFMRDSDNDNSCSADRLEDEIDLLKLDLDNLVKSYMKGALCD